MDPVEKKEEVLSLFQYLKKLIHNPVEAIKKVPEIEFSSLILFQFILCVISVGLSNFLAPFAINWVQLVLSVIASFLSLMAVAVFFHYYFFIFIHRHLPFRSLCTLVFFAHFPFAILHLCYYYFPVADLIGLLVSCILMIIGLIENHKVLRRRAIQLMSVVFLVSSGAWGLKVASFYKMQDLSTPQSLDHIEREVQSEQQELEQTKEDKIEL